MYDDAELVMPVDPELAATKPGMLLLATDAVADAPYEEERNGAGGIILLDGG